MLIHYHSCKDQKCLVCGPVHQTIWPSNKKEKMQLPGLHELGRALPLPEPYKPQPRRRKSDHVNVTTSRKKVVQVPLAAQALAKAESENLLINSFTIKDMETHLAYLFNQTSLLSPDTMKTKACGITRMVGFSVALLIQSSLAGSTIIM